jgi:hypothetical protein
MSTLRRRAGVIATTMTVIAVAATTSLAVSSGSSSAATTSHATHAVQRTQTNARVANLRLVQRDLWSQHMEWTYATVAAFVQGSPALDATMARLLRNQEAIGNSIRPYYGDKAADQLTSLLKAHINGAVPVLVAAKAGNTADLNAAIADWNANADEIAAFLSKANPNLPAGVVREMLRMHISQTVTYAADMLQGNYGRSIRHYDMARRHMLHLADALTIAIAQQFPQRF